MDSAESNRSKKKWLTWGGGLAFAFFLLKGLAWLALPAVLAWWGLHQ